MRQIETVRKFARDFDASLCAAREEFLSLCAAREEFLTERGAQAPDPEPALEVLRGTRGLESLDSSIARSAFLELEAIILGKLRPAYLILRDQIKMIGDYCRADLIEARRAELEAATCSVGRVDLFHHSTLGWAGTGWLVADDIAVTSSQVAMT